jgi:limonene-1,2-epoxide hydrolase
MSDADDPLVARNEQVVRAFLKGWEDRNLDACLAQITGDMIYLNHPHEKIVGKKDVGKMIGSIFKPSRRAEFVLLNVIGRGNIVMTERLDKWDWDGNGFRLQLPVCGVFEMTIGGKIREWREYYDNAVWTNGGGPTLVMADLK